MTLVRPLPSNGFQLSNDEGDHANLSSKTGTAPDMNGNLKVSAGDEEVSQDPTVLSMPLGQVCNQPNIQLGTESDSLAGVHSEFVRGYAALDNMQQFGSDAS